MKLVVLIITVCSTQYVVSKPVEEIGNDDGTVVQSCDSLVYCQGELLDTVQKHRIFNDSKSFVDLTQINPPQTTIENFNNLMKQTNNNPSKEQVRQFVNDNFEDKNELEEWSPEDFVSNPKFLNTITDTEIKEFAKAVVGIWPNLARKVKGEVFTKPDQHSLIPVPNGFIIPGGRFKELYYWDSYWILKGLLLSEMTATARGMIENLLSLVEKYGFVPNGSRVYYLNRSQPPLLTLMVGLYMEATNDKEWLQKNIATLEKELNFWLKNKTTVVEKDGIKYTLAHYTVDSSTPRPESYSEDIATCAYYQEDSKKASCYQELKSGAESGWDFSSRWFFDSNGGVNTNLSQIGTRRVVPVDLNSFLCNAFKELSGFYTILGDYEKSILWQERYITWQKSIELVLYNKDDGIWYDYDILLSKPRKLFFPSNFAPLWSETYDIAFKKEYGSKAAKYFSSKDIAQTYKGGIPTSIDQSGEQWDLPNAWPPLQEIVVLGLFKTEDEDARKIADLFARRWIDSNLRGYNSTQELFEKYDALHSGQYGGGGEYVVQAGFGWTNGVVLSLIDTFYTNNNNNNGK